MIEIAIIKFLIALVSITWHAIPFLVVGIGICTIFNFCNKGKKS